MTRAPGVAPQPWYKEPYVWLIVGGPLIVVLASVVTITLAIRNPDPVLRQPKPTVKVESPVQGLTPEQRKAAELSVMPAGQARNHVVSPTLPKSE
jgi:uncharacterized protein